MLAKISSVITLVCLAGLFLQSVKVVSLDFEQFKLLCVVGAIAALIWAVTILF